MFSASLISMLVHSAGPSVLPEGPSDVASVETDVGKLASRLAYAMFPWDIPVVLRTDDYISLNDILDPNFQLRRIETSPGGPLFVWGRVEAERLARFFAERYAISVRREYVDLGTPLAPASGMSASLWQECHNLFGQTRGGHAPEITVAFIDRGDAHSGPPADFGGRVTHLNSNNVELSPHALQVLWVLLDR